MNITISKRSLDAIIYFEISSPAYYAKFLTRPIWPGLASGITVGIGYDLGYYTPDQIRKDWSGLIPDEFVNRMVGVAGKKGNAANVLLTLPEIKQISIPYDAAQKVFLQRSLPVYAKEAAITYPGLTDLLPDAIGALVSLIYNRGGNLMDSPSDTKERRKEMAAIKPLVAKKDYAGIANQIRNMKRLWEVKGLLDRRDKEAELVLSAARQYLQEELVMISI